MAGLTKAILTIALVFHFGVLILNNLVWSSAVERRCPLCYRYPIGTGQIQGWGMYESPMHNDARYEVVARYPSGSSKRLKDTFSMDARELYFLETLFFVRDGPAYATAYLDTLYLRWPDTPKPSAIIIAKLSRPIPDLTTFGPAPSAELFRPAADFQRSFP
jgi:hypothetical protein